MEDRADDQTQSGESVAAGWSNAESERRSNAPDRSGSRHSIVGDVVVDADKELADFLTALLATSSAHDVDRATSLCSAVALRRGLMLIHDNALALICIRFYRLLTDEEIVILISGHSTPESQTEFVLNVARDVHLHHISTTTWSGTEPRCNMKPLLDCSPVASATALLIDEFASDLSNTSDIGSAFAPVLTEPQTPLAPALRMINIASGRRSIMPPQPVCLPA